MPFVTKQVICKWDRAQTLVKPIRCGGVVTVCVVGLNMLTSRPVIAEAPISMSAGSSITTGSPLISLDFARASVSDILTMIGQQGGVDIVVGEDVTGTLKSVHLTDKSADQAIRIITAAAGLTWKKADTKTYVINKVAAVTDNGSGSSSDLTASGLSTSASSVPDSLVPTIASAPTNSDDLKTTAPIELRNIQPSIMAYWLDPVNHAEPAKFKTSHYMETDNGKTLMLPHTMAPPSIMPNANDLSSTGSGNNGNVPAWARPGSGWFNPYTNANPEFKTYNSVNNQFGSGGSTGTTGTSSGTGTNGSISTQQAQLPSGAGTVALPTGVDNLIAIDPQNILMIRGTDEGIEKIREIVRILDRPIPQVEIETQFVSVNHNSINSFGLLFSNARVNGTPTDPSTNVTANPNGGIFNLSVVKGDLKATLNATINNGGGRVVNAPRVTTFNNLAAQLVSSTSTTIPTKQTVIIPNGNGTPITTEQIIYTTIPSGTTLTVIPTINRDGTITMTLNPSVSLASPSTTVGSPYPDISNQSITTSANIKDGDTLAIGGFRTQNFIDQKGRVPILSDIPLFGRLFRSKSKTLVDTDLIILVTAHVVRRIDDPVPGT